MEGLRIIEYTPAYAKAVAEMWQKSAEGFNGENMNQTEESVLAAHASSTDINTYLAVLGEEVVGYCGFTKYLKDEGALHIRLLNARYDLHGKGIGKALVKKAVERTIELKWPRLDLYTWPANTKAIPLYKKCGYFFERRQDTTHLMNFIPTVMNTEAVKAYFEDADWYEDMKRTINMEQDGRFEKGFDFYEYLWDKNGKRLRMEFERKGRGLRLIENEDYMISLSAEEQNLIFGRSYKACYEIINKTGKLLEVEIIGRDDKNIKFSFYKKVHVKDKEIIEGEFYVSEVEEEFSSFKTHPAVVSDIVVNGRKASFKLGIVPKFPGKISIACDDSQRYSGETFDMYIDIESCLNEEGSFEFQLPRSEIIDFSRTSFKILLKEHEKASIPVECRLKNPGIYQAALDVFVTLESGERVQFKKNTGVIFRGPGLAFGGEIEGKYAIVNGAYKLTLDKNYNQVELFAEEKKKDTFIMYPKLGMPYSDGFSSVKVQNVKWYEENKKMVLNGEYSSKDFNGITVRTVFKISADGIFEHFYEVINTSDKETREEVYVKQTLRCRIEGAAIPYGGKIVYDTEPRMEYPGYYNSDKISENWIFSKRDGECESLIWPENIKPDYNGWFMNFEHKIGKMKGGEVKATEPVYIIFSAIKSYEEARSFALLKNSKCYKNDALDFEVSINNGNPFVSEKFDIDIIEHRELSHCGKVTIKSENSCFQDIHVKLQGETNKISIPVAAAKSFEKDTIYIECDFDTYSFERKAHVFYVENYEFSAQIGGEGGKKVYSISNGVINLKASPEFSTGIFSLKFMDREWLDNSFPSIAPKSWYNPWFGGIQNLPEELIENARILLKEQVRVEFTEKYDSLGNRWKGIKTSMCYAHDEDNKGLQVEQYFLMLPGVPVLLTMAEITNNMNKYIKDSLFTNVAFLKTADELKDSWVRVKDYQGSINRYRPGVRNYEIYPYSSPIYGADASEYKIQISMNFNEHTPWVYLSSKDMACLNRHNLSLAPGKRKPLSNVFYIFTKEHIPDKLLKNLQNIIFE